jgi:hypothetical protein
MKTLLFAVLAALLASTPAHSQRLVSEPGKITWTLKKTHLLTGDKYNLFSLIQTKNGWFWRRTNELTRENGFWVQLQIAPSARPTNFAVCKDGQEAEVTFLLGKSVETFYLKQAEPGKPGTVGVVSMKISTESLLYGDVDVAVIHKESVLDKDGSVAATLITDIWNRNFIVLPGKDPTHLGKGRIFGVFKYGYILVIMLEENGKQRQERFNLPK